MDTQIKNWQTAGVFPTFEEADLQRNKLQKKFDLVKVKRCGIGGDLFKVKTWNKPAPPKKEKPKAKAPKGQYKKGKKNARIRSGQ
jgi:hypothetical protein